MPDSSNDALGPPPGLGTKIGRYRIGKSLGMGGMASVFLASAPDGTPVAVKVMHPNTLLPEDRRRFTREYEALSRMDHPNVVRVYEAGMADNYPWIAMKYIDGQDLEHACGEWRDLPPAERWPRVEEVLRGLCAGLQYVHDQGLVHRDFKPTNVLMTAAGVPKISDFGVAKDPSSAGTALTKAGRLVGTVAFMAPEQITGEPVDQRTDLYSLGAVLYVMLTGRRPIEARSVAGYLARHLTEVPRPPGQVDPTVPPRLEKICMRLLAKEPDHRYPTARAVLQALDRPPGERRLPLRGRDAVLAHWGRRLSALREGRSAAIAITGPDGSGRSFLLSALADETRAREVRVMDTRPDGPPLHELLGELAADRSGPATALLVDDLDELPDADVGALIQALRETRTTRRRPMLLAYTAGEHHGRLADLTSGAGTGLPADQVLLEPLDRATVVTMLRDRGITGPAAPVLGRRLFEDFGGLPGAVDQQLEALFDAGWLHRDDDEVRVLHPIKALRRDPLPVPPAVRARLQGCLATLDPLQRELVDVLALLDRPASAALLERCVSDATAAARALDALVHQGMLRRHADEAQETLEFAHPSAAGVVREAVDPATRKQRHAAIARALSSRRRRDAAREVATHLMHAGDLAAAYPMFVRAARRAARAGLFLDVLDCCHLGEQIRANVEHDLDPAERARLRRWLCMLAGEAELARGRWDDAIEPLEQAVGAARVEGDPGALARCLGSLGRAHYRRGRFGAATPLLEEALHTADQGAPERAAATRALADIRLREGKLEVARTLWQESLEIAVEIGSRDSEARARRGLAHVAALRGHLARASDLLDTAEDLLKLGGDDRVRAGVMARALELDTVAGRYGSALLRAEALVELTREREMAERMPEAFALQAEVLVAVGRTEEAAAAARDALTYAHAQGPRTWDACLRAARVWCELGDRDAALQALPEAAHLPASRVDDPSAQLATLRARAIVSERPMDARDLAHWAMVRPAPLLGIRAARIAADASRALAGAGDTDAARSAAKRGLRSLEGPGGDGLRLELLLAFHAASPDPRILGAAGQVAGRLLESLPSGLADSFRARREIAAALAAPG